VQASSNGPLMSDHPLLLNSTIAMAESVFRLSVAIEGFELLVQRRIITV
jgi:hypothetical protein